MVSTIVKKLNEQRYNSLELGEVLYEAMSRGDYLQRNKEFKVGDIILTKYYSGASRQMVSAHRVLIITRIEKGNDYIQYEGYPIKTDHPEKHKSNRYTDKYPNSLGIKNYSTILVPGEDVVYDSREAFIDVADPARFRSYDIVPKDSSYAGHSTDEFFSFVQKAVDNYKSHKDNSSMKWEK